MPKLTEAHPRIMKKAILLFALGCLVVSGHVFAQFDDRKPILQVGLGAGVISYMGDLSANTKNAVFVSVRSGYALTLERRFANILAVSIDGLYGKAAFSERALESSLRRNFEAQVIRFGLNVVYHFDNGYIINPTSPFTPYISAGVGYTLFTPYSDLQDKNGNTYHYWSNGLIMDRPQDAPDAVLAESLQRDYTYETKLDVPETGALVVPLTFGLNFKATDNIHFRVSGTYNMLFSDYLDGFSDDAKTDAFIYTSFSISYILRSKKSYGGQEPEEKVDFAAMDRADEDGDGVPDIKDDCLGTPTGVKVDAKGCPLDTDGDGVPDYLDKEPATRHGALVDSDGIELTDERLAALRKRMDSVAVERSQFVSDDPSFSTLKKIDKQIEKSREEGVVSSAIPSKFRPIDTDRNGIISAAELSAGIDSFFEGEIDLTASDLNELIDFFFEQ